MAYMQYPRVILGNNQHLVRFSFPYLFEPHAMNEGDKAKYSLQILIDKNDSQSLEGLKNVINEIKRTAPASGMWGGRVPSDLRIPVRDGDAERPDDDNYHGMFFMNANATIAPGVVDRDGTPITDPAVVYPGCYGRVEVAVYPYDFLGNKGIGIGLQNVQKVTEGPRLDSRRSASDIFKGFDNSAFGGAVDTAGSADNVFGTDMVPLTADEESDLPF